MAVDYEAMPSPLRHESPIFVNAPTYDAARKQRLAALAERVKSWEDDMSHPTIP